MIRRVALSFVLASLLASSAAHADLSDAERRSSARALFFEGVSLQDKGNFAEALRKFEGAEKLFNAPTHLLRIAECQAMLGKLLESAETYRALAREVLPSGSPEAFAQAQKQGAAELPGVEARIPTLKISVSPQPSQLQNLTVLVNGTTFPLELIGLARPVNPGSYKVSAYATGYAQTQPEEANLKERDQSSLNITLKAASGAAPAVVITDANGAPSAAATPAPTAAPTPPPYTTSTSSSSSSSPAPSTQGTSTGLLLGLHGGGFFPAGTGSKSGSFGAGINLSLRFARYFHFGIRGESTIGGGSSASREGAVVAAFTTSANKTSFYGELSLGSRALSTSTTTAAGTSTLESASAVAGLRIGIWIPAGDWRFLPVVGGDSGKFNNSTISTYFVGLGIYRAFDFGK